MEELDIAGVLDRLKVYDLSPIERVLAGHTGTVQLLLSLYFDEPVDVVLMNQEEKEGAIHRVVSLRLRRREIAVCHASSVIRLDLSSQGVLTDVRGGKLGLGQIAVKYSVPTKRTIGEITVTPSRISRQYIMEGFDPGHQYLHYVISESFPRKLFR